MARNKDDESDGNVEDDMFCFLEFLFFPSRHEDEESCIDNENHTDDPEKGIEVVEYTADHTNTLGIICPFDHTATRPEKFGFFTIRTAIDRRDECPRNTYEQKSWKRINNNIFSLFCFLFISATAHDDEERIDHHPDERHTGEHLEESNYRWEDIDPDLPPEHRTDHPIGISNIHDIPYREGYLHEEYSDRDPDNIVSPLLHMLFICTWEEEFDNRNDEKDHRDTDEEVLDLEGNLNKGVRYTSTRISTGWEEKISNGRYEVLKDGIRIARGTDIDVSDIEIVLIQCPCWGNQNEGHDESEEEYDELHSEQK